MSHRREVVNGSEVTQLSLASHVTADVLSPNFIHTTHIHVKPNMISTTVCDFGCSISNFFVYVVLLDMAVSLY